MMGEAPRGRTTHLISQLCHVAAGEASELIINGDDWETADGTCDAALFHPTGQGRSAAVLVWPQAAPLQPRRTASGQLLEGLRDYVARRG